MTKQSNMAAKKRILIVEDNATNLKLFRDVLANAEYEVHALEDGHHAHNEANKFKPDLVLLDIQLKNISGIEVLKSLREDDAFKQVPIVAVTAFAMAEDRERFLAEGFDHYITKPISIGLFLQEINQLLISKK